MPDACLLGDKGGEVAVLLDDHLPARDFLILPGESLQLGPSRGGKTSGDGVFEKEDRLFRALPQGGPVVRFP